METITNAASTVTSTVSNLLYGQPAKENETGGQEPLSGEQGKGTLNDPFDQGNSETPVSTTTGNTGYKQDDFLKLDPTLGKPAATDASTTATTATTGATGGSSLPILPLTPDTSSASAGQATSTSSTGVADKEWKPTELDAVKPSGAPGAGPAAPDYKVATPHLPSPTSSKPTEHAESEGTAKHVDAAAKTSGVETSHSDAVQAQPSVGGPIEEMLNKGTTSKSEHTVPESEAQDPHSKMSAKTVRSTEAHKTDVGTVESHPAETSSRPSPSASSSSKPAEPASSSKPAEPASPSGNDEKSEKKMSALKDKLKNKLHIGTKDK
ncbi:hypothetical protein ACEQ8H_002521 [Pleosporales sp. CAS-2024a]